ncbi:MAG TPA: hypothetical protein VFA10_16500 [Ktedonobacteraceae bacterium]|jgi:hypothetical protein|nr:hypothetical protein [Ktedonobacteraceae bacterium]
MVQTLIRAKQLLQEYAREDRKRGWNRLSPLTGRQLEISQQLLEDGWYILAERENPNQPVFHLIRGSGRKHKPRLTIQGE